MKKKLLFLSAYCLLLSGNINAQVSIGSDEPPVQGTLLHLKENDNTSANSTKGLGLPRVALKDIRKETDLAKTMGATAGSYDADEHIGLVVYNVGKDESSLATRFCPGLHVWDGTKWQPLAPYSNITETKVLESITLKDFSHLTPTDPMWAMLGKNASDYPLGLQSVNQFTDNRDAADPQTYYYARFYVGYTTSDDVFKVTRNLTCDQDPSGSTTTTETIIDNLTFEDGVWMTENLRAITMPDGTAIPLHTTNSPTDPQILYPKSLATNRATLGVLYNWAAAINMGTSVGQTPDPGNVNQGELNEKQRIQGVCPKGWHLPSDRQWTDLENGIIINTNLFSSTPNIGVANMLSYTTSSWRGTHSASMKSQTAVTVATGGTSKPVTQGGFNGELAGHISNASDYGYGTRTYFWSASANGSSSALSRSLASDDNLQVARGLSSRSVLVSVRCKKD